MKSFLRIDDLCRLDGRTADLSGGWGRRIVPPRQVRCRDGRGRWPRNKQHIAHYTALRAMAERDTAWMILELTEKIVCDRSVVRKALHAMRAVGLVDLCDIGVWPKRWVITDEGRRYAGLPLAHLHHKLRNTK